MSKKLCGIGLILIVSGFYLSSWIGRDFGYQWDESQILRPASLAFSRDEFLPEHFNYPSVPFWITVASALPESIRSGSQFAAKFADSDTFKLRTRMVFCFVVLFSIIWVFVLAHLFTQSRFWSLISSALLGTSWEFAYHARWVTCDCLMAQFSILSTLTLVLFLRSGLSAWLWTSAITAGICCGSKYPGGLMILTSSITIAVCAHQSRVRWERVLQFGVLSAGSYLLSTPATYIMPIRFFRELGILRSIYAGGHLGYTVHGAWQHFGLLLGYLATQVFSPYFPLAVLVFCLALYGVYRLMRFNWCQALPLTLFPLLYTLFFIRQHVLIVRNYMVLVPFLTIWAAVGGSTLSTRLMKLRKRLAWVALTALLGLTIVLNEIWLFRAAETIRSQISDTELSRNLREYLLNHVKTTFLATPTVYSLLSAAGSLPPNLTVDSRLATELLFVSPVDFSDAKKVGKLRANRPWIYELGQEGPYEVNYDYYPTWMSARRPVSISLKSARDMGLFPY